MSTDKQEYGRQLLALIRKLTESDGTVTRNERAWLKKQSHCVMLVTSPVAASSV